MLSISNLACFPFVQMVGKVRRVTKAFFEEGGGNMEMTAKLLSNFTSQRLLKPFVSPTHKLTPQERFGENAIATLKAAKKSASKAGSPADILRRHIIAAGSAGPLTPHKVCVC